MEKSFKKEIYLFLGLIFLSGFLLFLDKKGWLKPLKRVVGRPLLVAEERLYNFKLWGDSFVRPIVKGQALEKEIGRLQGELQRLAVNQNQLSACLEENAKMSRLLGAPLPPNWKFLSARVVGVSEQMRIDKGKKDGLKEGMVVLSENILVGKVVRTNENDSFVQLPITPEVKIPVVVKKSTPDGNSSEGGIQARGLLLGQYGGKLILDRVLQGEDIQKGDLVVTSGEEEWLPEILVGRIGEVLPKSAEIYRKAQIEPLVNYQQLRMVFVVIK